MKSKKEEPIIIINKANNAKIEYGEFYNKNIIYKRNDGTILTVVYDGKSDEYISRKLSS